MGKDIRSLPDIEHYQHPYITNHDGEPACSYYLCFGLMDPSNIIGQPNTRTLRTKEYFPSTTSAQFPASASSISSEPSSVHSSLDSSHNISSHQVSGEQNSENSAPHLASEQPSGNRDSHSAEQTPRTTSSHLARLQVHPATVEQPSPHTSSPSSIAKPDGPQPQAPIDRYEGYLKPRGPQRHIATSLVDISTAIPLPHIDESQDLTQPPNIQPLVQPSHIYHLPSSTSDLRGQHSLPSLQSKNIVSTDLTPHHSDFSVFPLPFHTAHVKRTLTFSELAGDYYQMSSITHSQSPVPLSPDADIVAPGSSELDSSLVKAQQNIETFFSQIKKDFDRYLEVLQSHQKQIQALSYELEGSHQGSDSHLNFQALYFQLETLQASITRDHHQLSSVYYAADFPALLDEVKEYHVQEFLDHAQHSVTALVQSYEGLEILFSEALVELTHVHKTLQKLHRQENDKTFQNFDPTSSSNTQTLPGGANSDPAVNTNYTQLRPRAHSTSPNPGKVSRPLPFISDFRKPRIHRPHAQHTEHSLPHSTPATQPSQTVHTTIPPHATDILHHRAHTPPPSFSDPAIQTHSHPHTLFTPKTPVRVGYYPTPSRPSGHSAFQPFRPHTDPPHFSPPPPPPHPVPNMATAQTSTAPQFVQDITDAFRQLRTEQENFQNSQTHHSVLTSPTNYSLRHIPTFAGNVDDDFEEWRRKFLNKIKYLTWPEQQQILLLDDALTDRANLFYRKLPPTTRSSLSSILAALEKQYGAENMDLAERAMQRKRKQLPGESIEDYTSAILKLVQRLRLDRDIDQVALYIDGLDPSIQGEVYRMKPNSIDQAEKDARLVSSTMNRNPSNLSPKAIAAELVVALNKDAASKSALVAPTEGDQYFSQPLPSTSSVQPFQCMPQQPYMAQQFKPPPFAFAATPVSYPRPSRPFSSPQ